MELGPAGDAVRGIRPGAGQERFVAPVDDYLALPGWDKHALVHDGAVVGFAMTAMEDERTGWIGGLVIDERRQGHRLGRLALEVLVEHLARRGAREVALSYLAVNGRARHHYADLGFRETGERTDDGEIVARRSSRSATARPRPSRARSA